jgi:hypothetical protein
MSNAVGKHIGAPKLNILQVSRRSQQPRNTSMPTGTSVELHPCMTDGLIPFAKCHTTLPMHTAIHPFGSGRWTSKESSHCIHLNHVHIFLARNVMSRKLQPRNGAVREGMALAVACSAGPAGHLQCRSVISTQGKRCRDAGVSEVNVIGWLSRAGVDDCVNVAASMNDRESRRVNLSKRRLVGVRERRLTWSI